MGDGQDYVLRKLYEQEYPEHAVGLEKEADSVYTTLRNTVVQKRGYQLLLIGARATGKTMLIDSALRRLKQEYPGQCIVVKVNGLCHGDDKLALREIAKQLDSQIDNGDESIEKTSMSQTLKSINRLFDNAAAEADDLDASDWKPVSVVFVIEDLESYTATPHQVLAYELFDLSLSSPVGVSVIATSPRLNVVELLEKRNRSRSNSIVHTLGKPKSIETLIEIGEQFLDCPAKESFVSSEKLREIATHVHYTTNSPRHLAELLLPHVLGVTEAEAGIMLPSTSELLLQPFDSVPEIDWAVLICAARAVHRYECEGVNLVIVLDEWRSMANADHANRFLEISLHQQAQKQTKDLSSKGLEGSGRRTTKPGSNPSSLLAVKYSWERLRKLGMLQPLSGQGAQEDLNLYVPELDLEDLLEIVPHNFYLHNWIRLDKS